MKKLVLACLLGLFTSSAFSQGVDLRRKIEVSGIAEQEVTADIINVSITLQEYMNGKVKVTIDTLESQLENAVKEAGIPKSDFTVNDVSGYKIRYQRKKTPGFMAGKQYIIRLHDLDKYNQILSQVDPNGTLSTNIESYDYSKTAELKRELTIQALLAAKNKATYLLNSIDEKLGGVISITEVENVAGMERATLMSNSVMTFHAQEETSDIDFKKIKLNFQIHAVFEIVK